jgi:hypothetical protein
MVGILGRADSGDFGQPFGLVVDGQVPHNCQITSIECASSSGSRGLQRAPEGADSVGRPLLCGVFSILSIFERLDSIEEWK